MTSSIAPLVPTNPTWSGHCTGHMYRMAIMAMLYEPDDGQVVDKNKLVKMALVHDMAESIVGDITPFDGITDEKKHEMEMDAMGFLGNFLSA